MASIPSQPSQRRSSPSEQASEASQTTDSQRPFSSMQSQQILLNPQSAANSSYLPTPSQAGQSSQEVRTCWICQQDDTDDESPDITWKSPCPCSLTAHDECLLEWIASEEAPKKGEIARNHKIKCPQCQAEIKIERPHDYLVQLFDAVHSSARSMVVPTALSGLVGCFYSGFLVYGLNTMQVVFGVDEARKVLGGAFQDETVGQQWVKLIKESVRWSLTAFDPFFPDYRSSSNWKIFVGLPLIGPSLIISRTKFADQAFALLLPMYFLDPSHRRNNQLSWPPTPGLAFTTLPYIRTAYNELYRHTVSSYEKKWDEAVQRKPREGETAQDIAAAQAQQDEGDAIFEVQIVHDHFEEVDIADGQVVNPPPDNEGPPVEINPGARHVQGVAIIEPEAVPNAPQGEEEIRIPVQAVPNAPNGNNNGAWEIRQDISTSSIITTTMGALFFPTVASFMGELLKQTLPARLVGGKVGLRYAGRGLLREKWGRTLVGGCLFVVLKDVVTLYCKWKKARDFGKRKVLNYVGERRRG